MQDGGAAARAAAADPGEAGAARFRHPLHRRAGTALRWLPRCARAGVALHVCSFFTGFPAHAQEEPLGRVVSRTEISSGLELTRVTSPLGVLLVIFESRPDALPQIASLAIRSGNGLLLKGGKEAARSNKALHAAIQGAIAAGGGGLDPRLVGLVTTRSAIDDLLKLDDVIDLVIPRGSNALARAPPARPPAPGCPPAWAGSGRRDSPDGRTMFPPFFFPGRCATSRRTQRFRCWATRTACATCTATRARTWPRLPAW